MLVYIIVFLGYDIRSIAVFKKPTINYKTDVIQDK